MGSTTPLQGQGPEGVGGGGASAAEGVGPSYPQIRAACGQLPEGVKVGRWDHSRGEVLENGQGRRGEERRTAQRDSTAQRGGLLVSLSDYKREGGADECRCCSKPSAIPYGSAVVRTV